MSGSSGAGGSINRPSENEDCANLVINTNLASPKADVIATLKEGDELKVQAATTQGPIQALRGNSVAGNIVTREQVRLLNCLNEGTEYIAEVLSITGGQCKIQVHAV
mgnify:CR=1 FL=1